MSKPRGAIEPTLEKPKVLCDYWDVVCLKQIERDGPWSHATASFPTQAEADAYADNLREGRHGAVKVIPRSWA